MDHAVTYTLLQQNLLKSWAQNVIFLFFSEMNTIFTALALLLAFTSPSLADDKTNIAFLKANLSFTMRDFGGSVEPLTTDFPLVASSMKGFGKWNFSLVQNYFFGDIRRFRIKFHCAEDCPSDDLTKITFMDTKFSSEGKDIFKYSDRVRHIPWEHAKKPGSHFDINYSELSEKPYGKIVAVSFNLFTERTKAHDLEVKTENARLKYFDACKRLMLANEKPVTLQFKDGNFSAYPSILKNHSMVLKEFLELADENEDSVLLDFQTFPKQVGAMMMEVFCYERVMTVLEDRAKFVSTLASLYELGHQFQMDSVMVAALFAFGSTKPQPTPLEVSEMIEVLTRKKSTVGDYFLKSVLQISIDEDALSQLHEHVQEA